MIKTILIDIDDTLLSFSGYVKQTMKEGFSKFVFAEYDETMYPVFENINSELWRQIERGTLTFEELQKFRWNRIFKALNIDFDGLTFEKFFREKLFDNAIPESGAAELLMYLSTKYVLCAASNGPFAQQMNRLSVAGIKQYFDHFFISERVGAQKPSKEFFDFCMKELRESGQPDLLPEEVMVIGDSVTSDIAGGKQYGMKTCLYPGGNPIPEGFSQADHVVKHLSEIMQFL